MKKIPTLFERDVYNPRFVTDRWGRPFEGIPLDWYATEMLDGANVRLTVRSHQLVRVEKRRNPSKQQKADGITEPWYLDASEDDPSDEYLLLAAQGTRFDHVPDGSWEAEALGPKIQGNPLNLESYRCVIFSLGLAPRFAEVPTSFDGLYHFLRTCESLYSPNYLIEGLVFYNTNHLGGRDTPVAKIRRRDFDYGDAG
jgi:hypothetical protein